MNEVELSPEAVGNILAFQGYGHPRAKVWFIGKEEGLGGMDDDDARINLKSRSTFELTMDMYQAHLKLRKGGSPIDIEQKPPSTQVWKYMAKIMQAIAGVEHWKTKQSYDHYLRYELGRTKGDTFLTELSPVPASRAADQRWKVYLKEKRLDLEERILDRKEELKRLLKANDQSLVICYGLSKRQEFAELLGAQWQPVRPKVYSSHNGKYLLLPFFGNGQMSNAIIEDLLACGFLNRLVHA